MTISDDMRQFKRFRQIYQRLNILQRIKTIYYDINGNIEWSNEKPASHFSRHEHIEVPHNIISDMVNARSIMVAKIGTHKKLANFLTETSGPALFPPTRQMLNIFLIDHVQLRQQQIRNGDGDAPLQTSIKTRREEVVWRYWGL